MQDPLFSVEGRAIVVTGAGRGLGAAYAAGLAERGARVLVTDIDGPAAERLAAGLASAADVSWCQTDVTDPNDVEAMVSRCVNDFGGIDAIVNNAGIALPKTNILDTPFDQWQRIVAVNQTGAFLCTQAAGRVMRDQGRGGSIVNIASTVAQIAIYQIAPYATTKGAVTSMTRGAAVDLAEFGIRVNAVAPGFIETEMTQAWKDDPILAARWASMIDSVPMRRAGSPAELVGFIVFLCSDASSYMTGTTTLIDGGFVIQ